MPQIKKKFVRVFGERNTGTRAMVRMLHLQPNILMRPIGELGPKFLPEQEELLAVIDRQLNSRKRSIYKEAVRDMMIAAACPTKAWKHTALKWNSAFFEKKAHVICSVRDPYSWAISLAKHPHHKKGPKITSLDDFLDWPWLTLGRDGVPPILRSPLDLWNLKNSAYLEFVKKAEKENVPAKIIRFEDFVIDPEMELAKVLSSLAIPFDEITSLDMSTKRDARSLSDISEYYEKETWKDLLSRQTVQIINSHIDWAIAQELGYSKLDSADFPELPVKTIEFGASKMSEKIL